ncbi:MAG: beta-propeller fold lactonase family protein [Solirubrobacterales bacterium]
MSRSAADSRTDSKRRESPQQARRARVGLVAAAVAVLALVFATVGFAGVGKLTQKSGTAGCIAVDGAGGACADGIGLTGSSSVTVSPDGKNAYSTGSGDNAIVVFDRDTSTGELTQKSGTDGCISETGSGGDCADGVALGAAAAVTVSADGKNVYAATAAGVAIFDRNTSTGVLTQKAGTDGCISENGTSGYPENTPGACVDGKALSGPSSITVTEDGTSVYVASEFSDAVVVLDRNVSTGKLTQKAGTDGCVSLTGTGGNCAFGVEINGPQSVSVSPDGENVYVSAFYSDAIAVFDRNATTGVLTQKTPPDACISDTGGGYCSNGTALDGASAVTVSPDGENVYATSYYSDAITIMDRDASTGVLTQKAGTDGCISQNGEGGACVDGVALSTAVSVAVTPDGKNVYVSSLSPVSAIAVLDRDTSSGTLTQKAGTDACVSGDTSKPCGDATALDDVRSVAVSPDGKTAYAAAALSNSVDVFTVNDGKIDGKASAEKTQKQKGKKIIVAVKVKTGEDLDVDSRGKITIQKKTWNLKPITEPVSGNKTLKMKPAKSNAQKTIAKKLKNKKGKANIDVVLSDDGGNSKTSKLAVTLKAK